MAEAAGRIESAKVPMLGHLHQNAVWVIEIQLIPATGPIGRIPVDISLDAVIRQSFSQ